MVTKGHTNISKHLEQYEELYKPVDRKHKLAQLVALYILCVDHEVSFDNGLYGKPAIPWAMEMRLWDKCYGSFGPQHIDADAGAYADRIEWTWKTATADGIDLSNMFVDKLMDKLVDIGWITCIVGEK